MGRARRATQAFHERLYRFQVISQIEELLVTTGTFQLCRQPFSQVRRQAMRTILFALLAVLALSVSQAAFAEEGGGGNGSHHSSVVSRPHEA